METTLELTKTTYFSLIPSIELIYQTKDFITKRGLYFGVDFLKYSINLTIIW